MSEFGIMSCHSYSEETPPPFFFLFFMISILTKIGRLSLNNSKGKAFFTSTLTFQTAQGPVKRSMLDAFKQT